MDDNFDKILDECIDRINQGDSLEDCLANYPEYARQLEPFLRVMLETRETYAFVPSTSTKMEARQRFNAARATIEQKRFEKQQSLLNRVFARPAVWATVATAAVILIAGYFGLRYIFTSTGPGLDQEIPIISQITPVPDPQGNFIFLISDDVNAIEDFTSVNVTIAKIGLLSAGDTEQWIEFEPEVQEVDLTKVKGDETQEIWRGNIPEGQYNKVVIHVANVTGVLIESREELEIKLPPEKLHVSKSFAISNDSVVSFVFDITVIEGGKSGQYILQPQVGESGADLERRDDSRGKGSKQ